MRRMGRGPGTSRLDEGVEALEGEAAEDEEVRWERGDWWGNGVRVW